jgi:dihydroflavonol-4-reductase
VNDTVSLTVVTGAAGHLGANLVRALLEAGRPVRCLVRDDVRALEGLGVERVRGDLSDPASLARAFAGARSVFHLAARISIVGSEGGAVERTNVDGVGNVIDACRTAGVRRLVHFSSVQALADPGPGGQLDEDVGLAAPKGLTAYDRSKVAAEQRVLDAVAAGLDAVICTPTAAIGPWDCKPSRIGGALLDLARGRMPAILDAGFDWVDARDVAAGALAAEEMGIAGQRYLLSGAWQSLAHVAGLVHQCGGSRAPRLVLPLSVAGVLAPLGLAGARLLGAQPVFTPDSIRTLRGRQKIVAKRSIAELGWAPRPLETTIADTLTWFRQAGMLS